MKQHENVTLDMGGGGAKSAEIISEIRKNFGGVGKWKNTQDDGASFDLGKEKLVFTTDAFIVDPLFFPGGDIGKIAMCGTINDLAVMGARPIGIGLSIVMEEGFPIFELEKIMQSIGKISKETGVPVVTGDTKVTGAASETASDRHIRARRRRTARPACRPGNCAAAVATNPCSAIPAGIAGSRSHGLAE